MALQVDIVTPERVFWSGSADQIQAPGVNGQFGVLPEHSLFLTLLKAGTVSVTAGGATKRFVVGRGFADVGPERVILLTDLAEAAESVDKEAAGRALEQAERVVADSAPGSDERVAAEKAAELARARLDA